MSGSITTSLKTNGQAVTYTDTFLGKNHKPVMLSLTERKSRFTLLGKVSQRTAQAVRQQTVQLLLPISDKVHTLTSDHGKEFACHQQIAQALQLQFYFAHPYAAWERGTNENTNGLLRQYFPKKQDAVFLTWILTRPILALVSATRAVAKGDLRPRVARWANDEIGDLAEAFNAMTEELARADELRREREVLRRQLLEK